MSLRISVLVLCATFLICGCVSRNPVLSKISVDFSEARVIGGVNHNDYELIENTHKAYLYAFLSIPLNKDMQCYLTINGQRASQDISVKAHSSIVKTTISTDEKFVISLEQIIEFGYCCDGTCKTREHKMVPTSGDYLKEVPVDCFNEDGTEDLSCI